MMDFKNCSPSSILTPEVTKTELLARIRASTMIVPRLILSRTPRAQLCDSLRLLFSDSSGVLVRMSGVVVPISGVLICRSWEHFISSFWSSATSCSGSFLCKLARIWSILKSKYLVASIFTLFLPQQKGRRISSSNFKTTTRIENHPIHNDLLSPFVGGRWMFVVIAIAFFCFTASLTRKEMDLKL